jgi:uncharacterized membrane protein YcfT
MTPDTARLGWVDTAKGISIILVVMMYAAYSVGEDTGGIGVLHGIIGFAAPFRMPEFFLISGLFLSRVIDRDWLRYTDRRVVHYLYFYVVWMILHVLFKTALAEGDPLRALQLIALSLVEPYGVLWFIYVLALVSAAVKLLHNLRVPLWAGFLFAAGLQIAPVSTGIYAIDQFAAYFVFFYTGYALAPFIFRIADWVTRNPAVALAGLLAWAAINGALVFSPGYAFEADGFQMGLAGLPVLHLVLAIAGALAICVMSALLAKLAFMDWLRWLGSKSLIVYLAFALPMSAVRIASIKLGLITDVTVLSLVVFVVALAAPVALYGLIQWTGQGKFLFERPAWAHIPGTPGSRSSLAAGTHVVAE